MFAVLTSFSHKEMDFVLNVLLILKLILFVHTSATYKDCGCREASSVDGVLQKKKKVLVPTIALMLTCCNRIQVDVRMPTYMCT